MEKVSLERNPRVLVLVVAYEAESTLAQVLKRIPSTVWELGIEVLVIDDSSRDRTFEVGLRMAEHFGNKVTVLYNPVNQGYGGNQKLGYEYAIRRGFDFVVLLHGDGQYAPECIPQMLAPLLEGEADAVFGSRMMLPGSARRGGMPFYKLIGNKILSSIENWMLGTHLSEFHSGFRAYRVSALQYIPFAYNTNAFHFDTEIIIQLILGKFRIAEVPIPTYYGDEICRVNGLRYAWDVIAATFSSRFHGLSILYDRKYDIDRGHNRRYAIKLGYVSSHTLTMEAVPEGAHVLDIGCGPGDFARALVRKGCIVDGVDQFDPAAPSPFRKFTRWNEPDPLDVDLGDYDIVVLLDCIEHLLEPEKLLDRLRETARSLDSRPRFVVTTGNIAFWIVRFQALLGNFNYGRRGILDMTHKRLYTFASLTRLFEQCGYRIERVEGVPAPFPVAFGLNRFSRALVRINTALIRVAKGLFSYQILLIVSPKPTVLQLLEHAIHSSTRRAATVRSVDGTTPPASATS